MKKFYVIAFVFAILLNTPIDVIAQNITINRPVDPLAKYDCVFEYSEDLALVRMGYAEKSKFGFIDKNKKEVIPCIYDDAWYFTSGRAYVRIGDKSFYIDKSGKQVISQIFEMAESFSHNVAAVKLNGKWGYIDPNGNTIIPFIYSHASKHNVRGYASVAIYEGHSHKYGMIDAEGNVIIPLKYDYLRVNLYDHKGGKEAEVRLQGETFFIDKDDKRLNL